MELELSLFQWFPYKPLKGPLNPPTQATHGSLKPPTQPTHGSLNPPTMVICEGGTRLVDQQMKERLWKIFRKKLKGTKKRTLN